MADCLIIVSVRKEADAIGSPPHARVVVSGIGRANAAAATTEAIVRHGPFSFVLNAGVAGVLPDGGLDVGDVLVASRCIYAEEGIETPDGFSDLASIGLALGDFAGNAVPVDADLLERFGAHFPIGPIATVATCAGSDARAQLVRDRTGAIAEAMEGAAVVHAARRLATPAIELRTISNTTGDRSRQRWDLDKALAVLGRAVERVVG